MPVDLAALERLARLRDSGVLTVEEFTAQKGILLSSAADPHDDRRAPTHDHRARAGNFLIAVGIVATVALIFVLVRSFGARGDTALAPSDRGANGAVNAAAAATPPSNNESGDQETTGTVPQANGATFPLSNHSFEVAVLEVRGANSSTASMVGIATPASISEWCSRNPGGLSGGRRGCIRQTMSGERGRRYRLTANCQQRRLVDWTGATYRYEPTQEGWLDMSTGEVISTDNSGLMSDFESRVLQFNLLCPLSAINIESE